MYTTLTSQYEEQINRKMLLGRPQKVPTRVDSLLELQQVSRIGGKFGRADTEAEKRPPTIRNLDNLGSRYLQPPH